MREGDDVYMLGIDVDHYVMPSTGVYFAGLGYVIICKKWQVKVVVVTGLLGLRRGSARVL